MAGKSCCCTGHRPKAFLFGYNERSDGFVKLKSDLMRIVTVLYQKGVTKFYTGMAEGSDIWFAETVLEAKKVFEDIELYAVIPFPDQKNSMSNDFKARYDSIMKQVKDVICTSPCYSKDCFKIRNYSLVDHSHVVVAIYDRDNPKSGTGQTYRYALRQNKKVIVVDPKDYR